MPWGTSRSRSQYQRPVFRHGPMLTGPLGKVLGEESTTESMSPVLESSSAPQLKRAPLDVRT